MKKSRLGPWIAVTIGIVYFLLPLLATFEFSLKLKRGIYSFEAYRVVLADPRFQASFTYSTVMALLLTTTG